ncbi:type III-A CRISPR-associated protein Csm2 [Thermosediminibacter oceani]|uniref:CRISPR system Cms protein Csm2 n=1 Tax=Thermosediminibacter oceani (strain ATCC BAA-1034 / DSM 16646 / JW/IW-1228P) TaxID=555079 RepID=D9S1M3_THEOJ|nr:type III-A CRISPR-associated protein Csm2 [Thermosediminibacter oceani]ADL07300.1 CRISPR-associated protein, Csm2 family [Thermosediminibacter oceani DSM 16646]
MAWESNRKGKSDSFNDVKEIEERLPSALDKNKDPNGDDFFYCAEKTGKLLATKRVSVSQIRKIFNKARRIKYEENGIFELRMLKAVIAYTAGRFPENMKEFKGIFTKAIEIAEKSEENLKRFKQFFEAVVAYHRSYGGRE